jgi:uncharacterized protein (TIGR02266 family)
MSQPSDNHRGSDRVPLCIEVSLESEHNFYTGITDNISEGGIFVATNDAPPLGNEVTFNLVLFGETFRVIGEVRWVRTHRMSGPDAPEGCGIRWKALERGALAAIQRFTHTRETLFYDED